MPELPSKWREHPAPVTRPLNCSIPGIPACPYSTIPQLTHSHIPAFSHSRIFWSAVTRSVARRTRHRFRDTHIKAVSRGIPLLSRHSAAGATAEATALQTARLSLAQNVSDKRCPTAWRARLWRAADRASRSDGSAQPHPPGLRTRHSLGNKRTELLTSTCPPFYPP